MMKSGKVTLMEIARRCGVSKPTVSAILGSSPNITSRYSVVTRQKVELAARELGYRPNRAARMMRHGRHGAIGLIVHKITYLDQATLGFLLHEARHRDQILILEQLPDDDDGAIKMLDEEIVDGLVLFMNLPESRMVKMGSFGGSVLHFNNNHRTGGDSVTFDEDGGVRLAVERFLATGRDKLAIVNARESLSGHYSCESRRTAFRSSCMELGAEIVWEFDLDVAMLSVDYDSSVKAIMEMLSGRPETEAVLLAYPNLIPVFYDAANQLGRKIPGDISVISFSLTEYNKAVRPKVTALRVDPESAAKSVMDRMDALVAGEKLEGPVILPYEIVELASG